MSYYAVLGLEREPFSTSPDPSFFYYSTSHRTALARLEIAIRLRRGLSVVLGDVGTGKTTLSRTLLHAFAGEENFIFHIVLDPSYKTEYQLLYSLTKIFGLNPDMRSTLDYRDAIERYLFQKGVDENKTIVLLIDEGHKLSFSLLETLRVLLNYETNEYKLLQLVILAQMELLPRLHNVKNFMDRISMKYIINPLDEQETREMIRFRLRQAGYNSGGELFSEGAISLIHAHTQGYPRQIAMLCHDALEEAVMRDAGVIDEGIINSLVAREVKMING